MSETKPFISVLMATYNEDVEYLSKAIDSILKQTYTNFEFLICDDSTNKDTVNVLDDYARKDNRIRIIRKGTRMGFVKSLNEGIRQSKGDWIARMDSDDIAFPNRFEEEIKHIGEDVGVIASQCINIDGDGKELGRTIKTPTSRATFRNYFVLGKTPIVHPTALINKKHLLALSGYDENFTVMEDYELWARIYCSGLRLVNVPTPLLFYRIHGNQAHTAKAGLVKKVKCICLIKFAYKELGWLKDTTFNGLMKVVENDFLCKIIRLDNNKHRYLNILQKIKIYPELPLLLIYLKYKFFGKNKIAKYEE